MSDDTIKLSYGTIDRSDIPLVMQEPEHFTYTRLSSWLGIIILSLLILAAYVVHAANDQHKIRNITSNLLINERDSLIKRCNLLANNIDIPNAKSIEINIPKASFSAITTDQLNRLFSFYITTKNGHMVKLNGAWFDNINSYKILLILSDGIQLHSLALHTLVDQIFAHDWQTTFKSFNILVRDKTDTIIWRDTIILDFLTGDSSVGYIGGGYISIQFDLDKYY